MAVYLPGPYMVTSTKESTVAGLPPWSNTYEFWASDVWDDDAGLSLAESIANFESGFHLVGVSILNVRIATWGPDGPSPSPNDFVNYPLNVAGNRGGTSDPVAREICALVRRHVTPGNQGKLEYRGCLREGDLSAVPGGDYAPFDGSDPFVVSFQTEYASIANYINTGMAAVFQMVMIAPVGGSPVVRTVKLLSPVRPNFVKPTKAWHNKTSAALRARRDPIAPSSFILPKSLQRW